MHNRLRRVFTTHAQVVPLPFNLVTLGPYVQVFPLGVNLEEDFHSTTLYLIQNKQVFITISEQPYAISKCYHE